MEASFTNRYKKDGEDDLEVDEAKVDENKQVDFATVEKRVRIAGGGRTMNCEESVYSGGYCEVSLKS